MAGPESEQSPIQQLRTLMQRLRDPQDGCPWDRKQSFASIVAHTLEEAYELADAIASEEPDAIRGELGDLLFQVIFYSQLAEEKGWFDFDAVAQGIVDKLLRRHPHVFPDGTLNSRAGDAANTPTDAIKRKWESIKQAERAERGQSGLLDDVPAALPALSRAAKLQKRAAGVGFDWDSPAQVLAKLDEERGELEQALTSGSQSAIDHELGDVLFTVVNLARQLGVDSEAALRSANRRFEQRFAYIERSLVSSGRRPNDASQEEMELLWQQAKQLESATPDDQ